MRKKLIIVVIITLISLLVIYERTSKDIIETHNELEKTETRGVFISYIDLENHFDNKDEIGIKESIDTIINNLHQNKFNLAMLQVRSHANALYKSELFPKYSFLEKIDINSFDPLNYFIIKCKEYNIKLYAWINPYRISSNKDINLIKNYNFYKQLDPSSIKVEENGLYLNPAKSDVTNLILKGAEEILNYDVDGLMFDDYFYPSKSIDNAEYNEYRSGNGDLSLNDFHINNINTMVKQMYELCHKYNKIFGISPSGNIETNYLELGADVKTWGSTPGFVDFLMPQVYYGFDNQTRPYVETIEEWSDIVTNKNISLYYALAAYKQNKKDEYAGTGSNEWIDNQDIIKRQIIVARTIPNYSGFGLYRYDSVFINNATNLNDIL